VRVGLGEAEVDLLIECPLADLQHVRRLGRDLGREIAGGFAQGILRDHAIDQAEAVGLFGTDHFAQQQHLHGRLPGHGARESHHRRGTKEPDVDTGRRELRVQGGDRKIAGRDQLAAGGGGDAVDLGDYRLRDGIEGHHQRGAILEHPRLKLDAGIGPQFPEIMARTEGGSGARDDHRPHRPVGADRAQMDRQSFHHRHRQGVARGRTVQRQACDRLIIVAQHVFVRVRHSLALNGDRFLH
jgi:hypothetical protein